MNWFLIDEMGGPLFKKSNSCHEIFFSFFKFFYFSFHFLDFIFVGVGLNERVSTISLALRKII